MNKEFKEFVTYKTLGIKHQSSTLSELLLDEAIEGESKHLEIKNVCTKMSKELADEIDNTVRFLDIRKRKFIELAIIQALADAKEIIGEVLDDDWAEDQAERSAK